MNSIVCVKEIMDPELPPESFEIDPTRNIVLSPDSITHVLSPFDENAVEAALRIKDSCGGKITILSLGNNLRREVVKKPLSMGADEVILLEDEAFVDGDSWSTALALSQAINKIGDYDLILCGRQAGDWDAGQVGLGIAEILGLPSITVARKIEVIDRKARVERVTPDGYEMIEISLPALITVSNEIGQPRYGTIEKLLEAFPKRPVIWEPEDIGIDPSKIGGRGKKLKLLKLFKPVREGKCEMIEGETLEEAAINLAQKLREAKVLF
jgi:electron transfer flavoprotein beta subunit